MVTIGIDVDGVLRDFCTGLEKVVKDGYLQIPKSLRLENHPISWIHQNVLQELRNTSHVKLNKEAIIQICAFFDFPIPESFL